jgi:hypothetical protein
VKIRLCAAVALFLLWALPGAQAVDMGKLKPEICKARATCRMTGLKSAGNSDSGASLMVAEFHFGLADKPKDGPEEGCRTQEDTNDGGVEYWLIEGGIAPRLLLKLCNDGYGAASVGYDEVQIGPNRLTHIQDGGSNDRWESTDIVSLSPQRTLRSENCGFRASDPNYGVYSWVDLPRMAAQSLAIDDSIQSNADAMAEGEDLCAALKKRIGKPVERGYLGALDIPFPTVDPGAAESGALPPDGIVLGGCAMTLRADGGQGYLAYGKPDPARIAELRILAGDLHTIYIQIYDPRRDTATAKSWVNADHLEIWTLGDIGNTMRVEPAAARQTGVDLDGHAFAGLGKPELPEVKRWVAVDEQNRSVIVLKLHWKVDEALYGGVAIAYSQAEGGHQARIFSTGPIVKNRPLYLPNISYVPVTCGAVGGRWEIVSNPGRLEPPGD